MRFSFLTFLTLAIAAPTGSSQDATTVTKYVDSMSTVYQWDAGWNKDFTIHGSCNDTQYNQIYAALQEVKVLSKHARDHTLKFGNESEFYQKYFGNAATGEVVGWYEDIVDADKSGALFRCDNPDGNCNIEGWAGHWRGENGTNENVICDLSYTSRLYLSQMCSQGYTVANSKNTVFWASDLLHRIWHTDVSGQGVVGHYADEYHECLELAKEHPEEAVRNSATLRYYALDVYAYDIAVPGVGCTGELEAEDHVGSSTSESSVNSATASSKSLDGTSETATTTQQGSECHTHSNGEVHCS